MRGEATYVQLIQHKEHENKVEALTHQKWSGSKMVDVMGGFLWKESVAAHRGEGARATCHSMSPVLLKS